MQRAIRVKAEGYLQSQEWYIKCLGLADSSSPKCSAAESGLCYDNYRETKARVAKVRNTFSYALEN